ncbi:hypothetical protein MMC24_007608 [Lignoscripta atroalba]|nr:hypothetical protein [Lignoscripta atroalba]
MPFNITIDHATTRHSSEHSSSLTDEEDSSGTGVQVSPSSAVGSQEYSDSVEDGWGIIYQDDIGPSDSASRPRTSNQHRPVVEAPQPEAARRQSSRRETAHAQIPHPLRRAHRQQPLLSPESVDSNEEWPGYAPGPIRGPPAHHGRPYAHWAPVSGIPNHNYAPSYSNQSYSPFPQANVVPAGQLVPFGSPNAPYAFPPYQQAATGGAPSYFAQGHHAAHPVPSHGSTPYGSQDMMHHPAGPGYFPYPPQAYPIPHPMAPSPVYHAYPPVYSPPPVHTPPPPPPPPDTSRDDEKFARLEKLFMDQKLETEAREAAAKKAEEDKIAKAEADKKMAGEIAAAASAAAAAATEEAEKKAAEEAAKSKAEAEAAKSKAEAEAAAAASAAALAAAAATPPPPPPPPEEKKKPIKFKDAVGRKFSFPFHLCNTWEGMEDLIRQAFLHVEIIGPHVAEGHYDLVGPNGEIILPQVWETMLEPDWTITMHMWPMPEPKPEEPPAPPAEDPPPPPPPPPPAPPEVVVVPEKKKRPKQQAFFGGWSGGRTVKSKSTKGPKKAPGPS